jgi:hypothetical protein
MRAEKASLEAFEAWDKDKHEEETKNGKRTDQCVVRTPPSHWVTRLGTAGSESDQQDSEGDPRDVNVDNVAEIEPYKSLGLPEVFAALRSASQRNDVACCF